MVFSFIKIPFLIMKKFRILYSGTEEDCNLISSGISDLDNEPGKFVISDCK